MLQNDTFEYMVQMRRQLHQYPEIGFDLPKTLALVKGQLEAMSIPYTEEFGKSSVVATINPSCTGFTIGIRGDMDALPIQEANDVPYCSKIPNQMHACGHDAHTAILLGMAKELKARESELACRVKLLFTPAEEYIEPGCKQMAENGVMDDIDCAIACLSGGTSQPPTETMHYVLEEMGWKTGLDKHVLKEINDFFKPVRDSFIKSGMLNPIVMGTDPDALTYQVPGGMLSNLVAQLTAQNKLDRFQEVLEEVPRVRKDLGYPPLVTPSSQMVGVQATNNVLAGERYKMVSKEIKAYLRGEYGKAPGQVDENLRKQVLGDEQPVTCRFADLLEPGFEKYKAEIGDLARTEEDVLSYAAFPQVAEAFLERRKEREERAVKYTIEEI